MRYRKLDGNGDYVMGVGASAFMVDSVECVAQSIRTRLALLTGEWFLDKSQGLPLSTEILGYGTQSTRDLAVKDNILNGPGVSSIVEYASVVTASRDFVVACRVETLYGEVTITFPL